MERQAIYSFPLQAVEFNTMFPRPGETSTPSILFSDAIEAPSHTQPHERQDVSQHIRQQNADDKRVGQELDECKRRKLRSKVWEDFEKRKDENGKDWARCKVCKKEFDGSSKLGTTHLRNHFKSCQRKRNGDGGGDEPSNLAGDLSNPIAIQEKSVVDKRLNHLDAARMIIKQGDVSRINSTNKAYIINVYKEEKEKLRNYFKKLSCRLCLTVHHELLHSNYLVVWFIDDDWKLKNKMIGFLPANDNEIIVEYIKKVLLEWGIENNLSSVVIDSHEDYLYRMIYDEIRKDRFGTQGSILFNNKLLCCESFFLELVDNRIDPDQFVKPSYVIVTRLFDNIRSTSSKNENFRNAIDVACKSLHPELTVEECLRPCGDVFSDLKFLLDLKETCLQLENSHPDFQNLTKEEWDALSAIDECFEDNGYFLLEYCRNYYTANTHFPQLCWAYKCCKELRKCDINGEYDDLMKGAENNWGQSNLAQAVASVLDPRFRMDIVKNWYGKIFGDKWETEFAKFMADFNKIYYGYARGIDKCTLGSEENNASFPYEMLDPLGKSCNSSRELDHDQWLHTELRLYFEEVRYPKIKDFDILEWWRGQARCFPTLARMARDFLSIQISGPSVSYSFFDDEMACIDYSDFCKIDSIAELDVKEAYIYSKSWLREEL